MADDTNTAEREALGFFLEKRGDVWVVQFKEGGCRPATIPEKALWDAYQAGRASLAASAGSEPVAWRDPSNMCDDQSFTLSRERAKKWPHIYKQPLYTHPSPPEGMAGWKDIATAPRDGTPIWLYTASGQCEGYWNYDEWVQDAVYCTYDGAGGPAFQCNPTHWQPLPAPPLHASEAKEL